MRESPMKSKRHASLTRLAMTLLMVSTGACGATDCGGCLTPLDHPFPEANKFNGAAQVRMTPVGVSFLEQQLPSIIQSFASIACDPAIPANERVPCPGDSVCVDGDHCEENGQRLPLIGFRVPYSHDPDSCEMKICENPSGDQCLVFIELNSISMAPASPAKIDMLMGTRIWSTDLPISREIDWDPACWISADCLYSITERDRDVAIPISLRVDNPLQRVEVEVGDPDIPLESDDLNIDGHLGCDFIDWIMPALFPLIQGALTDALNDTVTDSVIDMTVESCASPARCTNAVPTTCDGDQRCHYATGGRYVPVLMGVEGGMDLGALLGEFAGNAAEPVGISAAAGGYAEVVAEGIEIGLRGGTEVSQAACAPPIFETQPVPPRYSFGNSVAHPETGVATPFMLGIATSDRLLEEMMGGAVSSGALCQRIDSGLSSYINTGALGLLAGSLGRITRGGARPALIEMLPRAPLTVDLGLGTTMIDPDDPNRTILDEPLLTLRADDLDLDLYGLIDDRYTRFMTMRVKLVIAIGLVDDGQGNLMVLLSGPEDWLHDVQVLNSELLTDDPADIEAAVPSLIGTMFGQFAPDLTQIIALPDLAGFTLEDLLMRGVQQRSDGGSPAVDPAGNAIYEFLGVFANLGFDPAAAGGPLGYVVDTEARIHTLELPPAEAFDIACPGGLQLPELLIEVGVAGQPEAVAEYSYRVDGGFWRPFHQGTLLHVTDPALQLMGRHRVEIRGRLVGAPVTLDPEPVEVEVLIDPLPAEVIDEAGQVARATRGSLPARAGDVDIAAVETVAVETGVGPAPAGLEAAGGCGCASAPGGATLLAGLMLLGLRRRRR